MGVCIPEAKGGDALKVIVLAKLARREALHCNAEVILFDATPIVCDLEELEAATLGNYRDVG